MREFRIPQNHDHCRNCLKKPAWSPKHRRHLEVTNFPSDRPDSSTEANFPGEIHHKMEEATCAFCTNERGQPCLIRSTSNPPHVRFCFHIPPSRVHLIQRQAIFMCHVCGSLWDGVGLQGFGSSTTSCLMFGSLNLICGGFQTLFPA